MNQDERRIVKEQLIERGHPEEELELDDQDLLRLLVEYAPMPEEEEGLTSASEAAMALAASYVEAGNYIIRGSEAEFVEVNGRNTIQYFPTRRPATSADILAASVRDGVLTFVLSNGTKVRENLED